MLRALPDIFKPIFGVVLYFILADWLNMAVVWRLLLDRLVRSHEEDEESSEAELGWRGRDGR